MRTSEAARYARWAATVAILLAASVAGVYSYRAWQARESRKSAPPPVPPTVQQSSAEFSFSKVERDRALFTVRASRATEFKEGSKNLLEDVRISIFGREGQRADNLHTRSCDYIADTGRLVCAGEVQIDLESAEDARRHPGQRVIHVATSNVAFERESGEAHTSQRVTFRFPEGQGHALGVDYSTRNGMVRLEHDVQLTITPGAASRSTETAGAAGPITFAGSSLEYRHEARTFRLLGPVRLTQAWRELTAGELTLEFDRQLRAQRLLASRSPRLRSTERRGQAVVTADEFSAFFHPEGWIERMVASGNARGSLTGPAGEEGIAADRLELELSGRREQPRVLNATGNVTARGNRGAGTRRLETSGLRLLFAPGEPPAGKTVQERPTSRVERAESHSPTVIEWQEPAARGEKEAAAITRLSGKQLVARFDEHSRVRQVSGGDGVEVERRIPDRPPQVTSARSLEAKMSPDGSWTEIEETGDVHFREADRTAQAHHARIVRADDTVTLTGAAVLADAVSRTTARSVVFHQRTGELHAAGDVRTVYRSAGPNPVAKLAPQPAFVSADRLRANTTAGRALYSGHARLWQGDSVIEADAVELFRNEQQLTARGKVSAVFPEAPGSGAGGTQREGPDLLRIRAGALTYWSREDRALLEQNVFAQSRQGSIHSQRLELFFAPRGSSGAEAKASGLQLSRAVATGGVVVQEGARRATAERGVYTVAEGKFVLTGGRPTLYDASRGTVSGRQLTFFLASDTIIVESEEGSRTLTRYRVEK